MKKLGIILLSIFCISLLASVSLNMPSAYAISYYNWLKAPSFEENENLIDDYSFESGAFNSGTTWGNWSIKAGTPVFSVTYAHTGTESLLIQFNEEVWYNFTDTSGYLVADISTFSLYWYEDNVGTFMYVTFYYSDYTSEQSSIIYLSTPATWEYLDLMPYVQQNLTQYKYLVAIDIDCENDGWFDDVMFSVNGVGELGQTTEDANLLSLTTTPFYSAPNYDYCGILTTDAYTGNRSAYFGFGDYRAKLIQTVEYLDSDTIPYVSLWAKFNLDIAITCTLVYSDGTTSSKTVNGSDIGSWELVIFSKAGFIDANKYVIQIQIYAFEYFESTILIDDIGLWSTLQVDESRMDWSLTPTPISWFSATQVYLYQGIVYQYHAEIFDTNGDKTESGNYSISTSFNTLTGNFANGDFSVTISARTSTLGNFTETFGVLITVEGTEVLQHSFTVFWVYTGSSGSGGGDAEDRSNNLLDWIVMFCVMFLPAILLGGAIYENNSEPDSMHIPPIYGVIAGLIMSCGIGVFTGLVPLWILILTIVGIVILLIGMFKK